MSCRAVSQIEAAWGEFVMIGQEEVLASASRVRLPNIMQPDHPLFSESWKSDKADAVRLP